MRRRRYRLLELFGTATGIVLCVAGLIRRYTIGGGPLTTLLITTGILLFMIVQLTLDSEFEAAHMREVERSNRLELENERLRGEVDCMQGRRPGDPGGA